MKKRIYSILMVVVMTMALVACGSQSTNVSAPETTETVNESVESIEATSTPDSKAVDEVTTESETSTEVDEPESSEATSETESAEPESSETASTPDSEAVETTEIVEPESEVSEPKFTFTEVSKTLYAVQSVNVRSGPNTDFDKIGSLSTNQEVQVISRCNETGWYKFIWTDGSEACVSDKYLADEKIEVAPPASNNSGSGSANSGSVASNWADSYPKNQWIDMGEYFFYIANSQPEANQVCGDYMGSHTKGEDCHIYHPDLEVRYPDRRMYIMAFTTEKGNVPVAIVSTIIYDGNGDVVYVPKFIWE